MDVKTKVFWGLAIVDAPRERFEAWLEDVVLRGERLQIVMTPNPEQLMLARRDAQLASDLVAADVRIPDGAGLVWAGKFTARLTGADTCERLLAWVREGKIKIVLLGGHYESSDTGELIIAGKQMSGVFYTEGYKRFVEATPNEEEQVRALIQKVKPDVVLVALGAPQQERWLIAHRDFLAGVGVRLAMAVGGSFDFITGKVKRAPAWMRQSRLEWLYRLWQEPWRWRRQLVLPGFIIRKLTGYWER